MAKGTRLPFRLAPRRPSWLTLAGSLFVCAAWLSLGGFFLRDDTLLPHQVRIGATLLGVMTLLTLVGLGRPLATALVARSTFVEVDRLPAPRGTAVRCFVLQQGAGLRHIDVRLQCLRQAARGNEETVVDVPVGAAGPTGLRVQLEAEVLVPADAPVTDPFRVRWRIRVAADFDAVRKVVREFPLPVV